MRYLSLALILLTAACGGGGGSSAPVAPFGLTQRTVIQGVTFPTGIPQPTPLNRVVAFPNLSFAAPLFLTSSPDGTDRIFVVERDGRILVFPNDPAVVTAGMSVYLDLSAASGGPVNAGGEKGLLGLAFHPNYAVNGFFYVCYTVANPLRTRLSRLRVSAGDANRANPASETILLEINQPAANHNGGCLGFGPDGKLYLSAGDGGNQHDPGQRAQDPGFLLGKLLRLNADGSVPIDNPFAGQAGARGEIWAVGFRNPWRFSFDRNNGDLWLGDVGQNAIEEVNRITRGGNYGWDFFEGSTRHEGNPARAGFEFPVQQYSHSLGRSVTGGYVYRGPSLPSLFGAYVYADFITGRVWALVHDGSQVISNQEVGQLPNPASFGEDEAGELYACCFDGNIYRFEEITPPPAPRIPRRLSGTGLFADVGNLVPAPGVIEYRVHAPLWSDGAAKRRWLALPGTSQIAFQPTGAWTFPLGTILVKHFEIDTPTGLRRLETRILAHSSLGWQGYAYVWNSAQTDADLLVGSWTETLTVLDGRRSIPLNWTYPSRADCAQCHTPAAGYVLGVRTQQLNRNFPFARATDNQLRAWNHIGLFQDDVGKASRYGALVNPRNASAPLVDRARSYLASNCAPCHLPGGPTPVDMDLRAGILTGQMNLVNVPAAASATGSTTALRVAPFAKEDSELWERMRRLDTWRMPPLASHRIDPCGAAVVGEWIDAGAK